MAIKVHEPKQKTYSKETIRKIVESCNRAMAEITEEIIPEIHIHVSTGNNKIGETMNVSTPPIAGCCGNCHVCAGECYADGSFLQQGYDWHRNAWIQNHVLKEKDMERYFAEIDEAITDRVDYFRWHVSGDVKKDEEVPAMAEIAERHQNTRFLAFSKNYDAFNRYFESIGGYENRPQNFQVVFSVWVGLECPNPYGVPECHINRADGRQTYEHIPIQNRHHCMGDCEYCEQNGVGCFWLKTGEATIINQH